jgi:CTP:molybdopterin cytidylyltransferase MocA
MQAVPAIERIVVVLGSDAERVGTATAVETVLAEDWAEGIAASLRTGIAAVADADAVVLTLADQPFVSPAAIEAVLERLDDPAPAVRAVYDGKPGHPVLIKRELYPEIAELRGDEGARDLLTARGVVQVECGYLARPDDIDTKADLARYTEPSG